MDNKIENSSLFYQLLTEPSDERALKWIELQASKIEDKNTIKGAFGKVRAMGGATQKD